MDASYTVNENPDYEPLVVPTGNSAEPVHRWFHVKEAYSHRLLGRVIKDANIATTGSLRIVDPFSGSGTTAVAAADMVRDGDLVEVDVRAAEVNPFLHLVSATKFAAVCDTSVSGVLEAAQRAATLVKREGVIIPKPPALTTFANRDYFDEDTLNTLLAIRAAIECVTEEGDPERSASLVALASAIEPSSGLRRDGRALRYTPGKRRARPLQHFLDRAHEMDADVRTGSGVSGAITLHDAREPLNLEADSADLTIFSPPYPNNIDYTEIYKLEAWLLGLIDDHESFTAQRHRTLRSHPSLKFSGYRFPDTPHGKEFRALTRPLLNAIPRDSRYADARERIILGYLDDMLSVLMSAYDYTAPGGRLVYVVGNSLHGGKSGDRLMIASDILIARLAEIVGFKVDSVEIARVPSRRASASKYLRESVVFAHKPARGS